MTRYALVSGSRWIAGGFESATDAMLFGASYFPHHPLTFHPEAPTMTGYWSEELARAGRTREVPSCEHEWRCPACGEPRSADVMVPCPTCGESNGVECGICDATPATRPRVLTMTRTCDACPSQWSGMLSDGREYYGRYRWGHLTINAALPDPGNPYAAVSGDLLYAATAGDGFDGVMSDVDFLAHFRTVADASPLRALAGGGA